MSNSDASLEELLALCLEAGRLGVPIDQVALIEAHPEHADELGEFLAAHAELRRLTTPLSQGDGGEARPEIPPTVIGDRVAGEGETTCNVESSNGCNGWIQLGKYRLIRELGRGGMGVVYEAWQDGVNRPVALKVISAGPFASAEELKRFRTEAEAAANLNHPGLVPIYEVDVCDGRPFYSMELLAGQSLADLSAAGLVPSEKAATIVAQIADAVDFAHRHGVLHRDLKPANVIIDETGRPRVLDFGLAKRFGIADGAIGGTEEQAIRTDEPSTIESGRSHTISAAATGIIPPSPTLPAASFTRTGAILGTPSFMAPEQALGLRTNGPAADVYGLGAILYQLLTGRPPFKGSNPVETLTLVTEGRLEPVRNLNADVPADLAIIVETCLEKEPRHRYRSAAEVSADLRRFLTGEPIRAGGLSLWGRLARAVGQSRHISHFRQWGKTIMGFGLAIFIAHVVMQVLAWTDDDLWPVMLLPRLAMFVVMLAMLRLSRSGSLMPRDAVERLVWVVWTAYLLGYAAAAFATFASGRDHMTVYAYAAALAGAAFFTLGCHVWGACYLVGIAFFIAAPLLAVTPEHAILAFGALWGVSLGALGARYEWLNRVLPAEEKSGNE